MPRSLPKLSDGIVLCTMDVGRNNPDSRKEKYVWTDTIIDLAKVVFKK